MVICGARKEDYLGYAHCLTEVTVFHSQLHPFRVANRRTLQHRLRFSVVWTQFQSVVSLWPLRESLHLRQ